MMRTRTATLERAGQGCLFAHAIATKGALNGRHLPAAVVTDQTAFVAHAVPSGAELVQISGMTLGYLAKPARMKGRWTLHVQRLAEIERLIAHRHDGPCDTDEGELYLRAAMPHLMAESGFPRTPRHRANCVAWAGRWTPRLPAFLGPDVDWFAELEREFSTKAGRKPLRADTLAKRLCVTYAERKALGLKSIGATDMDARQRRAARKAYHVEYKRQKREREGSTPRARSLATTKPWVEAGVSRTTWYELQKAFRTISEPTLKASPEPSRTISEPVVLHKGLVPDSSGPEKKHSRDGAKRHRPRGERRLSAAAEPAKGKRALGYQLDLFARPTNDGLAEALNGYSGGIIPATVRMIVLDRKRGLALRQEDVARQIGISRPQLANAMQARFGLSQGAAARLKSWLAAA